MNEDRGLYCTPRVSFIPVLETFVLDSQVSSEDDLLVLPRLRTFQDAGELCGTATTSAGTC